MSRRARLVLLACAAVLLAPLPTHHHQTTSAPLLVSTTDQAWSRPSPLTWRLDEPQIVSTTTTTAPVPPPRPKRTTTRSTVTSTGEHPCGGDLPPCWVMQRESGGDPTAISTTPNCSGRYCEGKWQFDPLTWANFAGFPHANVAPESVQDDKARLLWAGGAGCAHWHACG